MANVAIPGFHPRSKGGLTVSLLRKLVLTNNTTAIFKGDACDSTSSGDVIVTATANAAIYSVQWGGASYISSGTRVEKTYLPAATTYSGTALDNANASYVYVVEDMVNTVFTASAGTAITTTHLGNNSAMTLGTGSTSTGLSGHKLDTASPATTATFPWRLIDVVTGDPTSDCTAADAKVIIKANASRMDPGLEIGGSLGT